MRRNTVVIVVAVLALLLSCCCIAGLATALAGALTVPDLSLATASSTSTQHVQVTSPATLVVRNLVGDVSISAGAVDTVTVVANLKANSRNRRAAQVLLEQVSVDVSGTGSDVTVEVTVPDNLGSQSLGVELTITVPAHTSLQVRNDVGDLLVDGITGSVNLRNNVGDVTLTGVTLQGSSDIGADVGAVSLKGALQGADGLSITTRIGSVTVGLPADSQFRLDARTDVGDVLCDFALEDRVEEEQSVVGHRLSGSFGGDPATEVQLSTTAGDVRLSPY